MIKGYQGTPYQDEKIAGGAQCIPGRMYCAYYDLGGEGVAYHDSDACNHGSGSLNPADGSYLNQFRMEEGVDISYIKEKDRTPGSSYLADLGTLYTGWSAAGEWMNYTVAVQTTGTYQVDIVYATMDGGQLTVQIDGADAGVVSLPPTNGYHNWGKVDNCARLALSAGEQVVTLRPHSQGMNYAWLEFTLLPSA